MDNIIVWWFRSSMGHLDTVYPRLLIWGLKPRTYGLMCKHSVTSCMIVNK